MPPRTASAERFSALRLRFPSAPVFFAAAPPPFSGIGWTRGRCRARRGRPRAGPVRAAHPGRAAGV